MIVVMKQNILAYAEKLLVFTIQLDIPYIYEP